ncbi:MAG: molybdopterin oxidoreductase family protein, partial [Actinomyces sp.]
SRLTRPLRRRPDGTYEEIDWDTAIAEVAAGLRRVADEHGGDTILYYGGGGQGNHLCGAYATALRRTLGITRRSNALAQEKTGEAWVEGRLFGTHTHGEFAEAQVAVFLGKNPWQSHGFDQARRILKEMAADPERTLVVIDPRRSETAAMADLWLRPRPGTDACLLAAVIAVLVTDGLVDRAFCQERASGLEEVVAAFGDVPVDEFAHRCGVDRAAIEDFARLLAGAESVSFYEDLGVQMAPHSTLVSYLQRLCWLLTGHFARPGCAAPHTTLAPIFDYSASGAEPPTPVTGSPIISGLIACNEIADTILTDHPDRTRALFIESANPVHSLAGSDRFRRAMRAADFSVVVDVAFTETAREADYVLPAASQYEKAETTFFSAGFPENRAWVRRALFDPLGESLPEAEIHRRLIRALGVYGDDDVAPLHEAARDGLEAYGAAFLGLAAERPDLAAAGAVVVYETLGPTLPPGSAEAAVLWLSAHQLARRHPDAVRAAGHAGDG